MTVDLDHISRKIQNEFKRDILVQLLSAKTSPRRRKELVFSARTSMSSQVSRRLLLEEHKLDIQLEQIEKERRHFLHNNNNEKHMLRLSLGLQSPGKYWMTPAGYEKKVKAKREEIRRRHSQGNKTSRGHMAWSPVSTKQNWVLNESHETELTSQQEVELTDLKNSLSWQRYYDTPQVPPPSRNLSRCPSTTNLFLQSCQKNEKVLPSSRVKNDKKNRYSAPVTARAANMKSGEENMRIQSDRDCAPTKRNSANETRDDYSVVVNIMDNSVGRKITMSPSVRRLDISKNIYQFAQQRCSANVRSFKPDEKLDCDQHGAVEINQSGSTSGNNVAAGRDEVGDNRSNVDVEVRSRQRSSSSLRSEDGNERQRRPRRPRNKVEGSAHEINSVTKRNSEQSIDLRVSCHNIRSEKTASGNDEEQKIEIRNHNALKYSRKKRTGKCAKREKTKNYGSTSKDVLGNQSNQIHKERSLVAVSPDGDFSRGATAVEKYNGNRLSDDQNSRLTSRNYNDDDDDEESWAYSAEESRLSTPSPFCLPSQSQMRSFQENVISNRKKTEFIKMRRYGNSYRKPSELQASLARDT